MNLGTYETDVELDIEEILDGLDIDEIEDYLDERCGEAVRRGRHAPSAKQLLVDLCVGRCRRNLQTDKEEVKQAILSLIDEVFV